MQAMPCILFQACIGASGSALQQVLGLKAYFE